ncbi:hypothetical protein CC2G_000499 [Coprinopsis cinerea AmutBmut pab1-1]|nr:hypothetical protein CC2G_000499 [Coprinopsis cinerea AmutBmut pab1-1]
MSQSVAATRSFGSLLETRQREDTIPRHLTLATGKLERLLEYENAPRSAGGSPRGGGGISPALNSARYSDFFSSSNSAQASPIDAFATFDPIPEETHHQESQMISLPPPPRRAVRRKRPPPVPAELEGEGSPTTTTPKSSTGSEGTPPNGSTGEAAAAPTETRKEAAEGVGEGDGTAESASMLSRVADDSSTSLLTVDNREIKTEPSFEELVVRRKTFSLDRPRIIPTVDIPPLLSIPTVPTPITERSEHSQSSSEHASRRRLPVDDRSPPPPTPVVIQPLSNDGQTAASPPGAVVVAASSAPASPTIMPKFASLPSKIEKLLPTRRNPFYPSSDSSPTLPPPRASAPIVENKTVLKGPSIVRKAKGVAKSKLTKARDIRDVEFRADIQPWRKRPLLSSHTHTKSLSRSSAGSCDSDTTYNPPSTIDFYPEHRISISSTIYPDDASYIHIPHSHHNERDEDSYDDNDNDDDDYYDQRHDILQEIQSEQVIDPDNYQLMSILSGSRVVPQPPQQQQQPIQAKPPLPTTPKPIFSRRALSPQSSSPSQSPVAPSLVFEGYETSNGDLPPTTNWLAQEERADLIRKSRKLARVFGRTPGPDVMAYQDCSRTAQILAGKHRHQRTPLSFSNDLDAASSGLRRRRASAWPSPTESHFSLSSRRHSAPLSPDDISFLNVSSPLYEASMSQVASQFRNESAAQSPESQANSVGIVVTKETGASSSPRTSFIDLYGSDEEQDHHDDDDDEISVLGESSITKKSKSRPESILSENMTPEEQAEEERRRKREKLAKLHRYLGSRVPANLVLGVHDPESNLPPASSPERRRSMKISSSEAEDSIGKKAWLRRRQSSSAALPPTWLDELERRKEELDTKEKALNVRRAQKMEKVFGVAPPQTLYHTRHSPSPSLPYVTPKAIASLNLPSLKPSSEPVLFTRNPNQPSYQKTKGKKNNRPGTAESSKALLPKGRRSSSVGFDEISHNHTRSSDAFHPGLLGPGSYHTNNQHGSDVYNHYQHSIHSLNDILDRDDRESLLELHNYINGEGDSPDGLRDDGSPLEDLSNRSIRSRRHSDASIKTERRRSLPTRSSNASLNSEISLVVAASPSKPDITDFQLRRRRAAKLTQFFGVHYRELISDVLDSLENGLEHERKRGTLQAEELEDLAQRLRELRVKREGLN